MIKKDLMKTIADRTGEAQKSVESILNEFADVVTGVLSEDNTEKIPLPNLGTFKIKAVAERKGVSAINGKPWVKPAHKELRFTIAKNVKELG